MRQYPIRLDQYGISKWQYRELKAFCRQYKDKLERAACMLSVGSQRMPESEPDDSGLPDASMIRGHGGIGRPVESLVIRREQLLHDVDMIDEAARFPDGGAWARALICSCCDGVAFEHIPPEYMPTSKRNTFFKARRMFFYKLAQLKYANE